MARRAASSETLRRRLVGTLASRDLIRTDRVRDAFLSVPRELFVPEFAQREGLEAVYSVQAILTKRNVRGTPISSSSQPAIMALMLERLGLERGMRVLEVGAGTGYNAALLSLLVGPDGFVVSVEVDPELARAARGSLRTGGFRARVMPGDGREGVPAFAPYDRIIVTASSDAVPRAWFEQLGPGGVLEVPLRLSRAGAQAIPLLRKARDGFRSVSMLAGGFMPLRSAGEAAAAVAQPMLVALDATGADAGVTLRQLTGDALRTLSQRAKHRLLALAFSEGRRRPLELRANSSALTLFLSLRVPARHLVTATPRYGIGAIARDGSSLALIEPPFDRPRSTVGSMRVFGSDAAGEFLLRHVRDWNLRGRPSEDDLAIAVSYNTLGESQVVARWPPQAAGALSAEQRHPVV